MRVEKGACVGPDGLDTVPDVRTLASEVPFPAILYGREVVGHEASPLRGRGRGRLSAKPGHHVEVVEQKSFILLLHGVARFEE